jgi:cobalt-zinc-cadmium efflux system outer membrane protein
LYPNPVLGANGEHNTPILNGGSMGGFIEQRVVMGGKLGLARRAAEQDRLAATEMQAVTRLRVLTVVRTLFYRLLGEQRLLEVRKEMSELATRTADTMRQLNNVGQADRPDLLSAEMEAQRAQLSATMAQNALDRTWREMAAVVNQPTLGQSKLEGNLEGPPALDAEQALARVLTDSPQIRVAQAETSRAQALVQRARAEKIPDLQLRGGVRYNNEPIDQRTGIPRRVGNEGIFDVGIEIPLFNRNQGGVAAAQAEEERARLEVERQRLSLRQRFAAVFREYRDATSAARSYREEMIPKAQQAFEMYTSSFRQMAVAYPQVLSTQRSLIQLQDDYVAHLINAWRAAMEIEGLLTLY